MALKAESASEIPSSDPLVSDTVELAEDFTSLEIILEGMKVRSSVG